MWQHLCRRLSFGRSDLKVPIASVSDPNVRSRRVQRLMLLGAVVVLALLNFSPSPSRPPAPSKAQPSDLVSGDGPVGVKPSKDQATAEPGAPAADATGDVTPSDAAPPPAASFPPVTAQPPTLRLEDVQRHDQGHDLLQRVREVPGVSFATVIEVAEVPVAGGNGPTTVRMAAVDPKDFRVLTPQMTADAVGVWERLAEGDAAFTHDAGHRLEVPLGSEVPAAGRTTLRIGAYASNGVPPVADAIVSEETAKRLGLKGSQQLYISIDQGASPEEVAGRIAKTAGLKPDVLQQPETRRAFLVGSDARYAFEPYGYIDNGDGTIQIDSGWVRRNIVRARVPIFGEVMCHRLLIGQLRGALQEIADRGLAHLINTRDYGGCWSPRHIDFNPRKPLSMHSWGLAIDINVSTNRLGAAPTMDPRIVQVFDRWGFVWGGRWRRPDGMHFELGALLRSPQG